MTAPGKPLPQSVRIAGTIRISVKGAPYVTRIPEAVRVGYARCSTDRQDLEAQRAGLVDLGVGPSAIYHRPRPYRPLARPAPALDQALAAVRAGDTLVVANSTGWRVSVPDARDIADRLLERGVGLALGTTVYDPADPMGKMFFNILADFAEFESDLIRMRPARAWRSHGRKGSSVVGGRCFLIVRPANSGACTRVATTASATLRPCSRCRGRPCTVRCNGRLLAHSDSLQTAFSLAATLSVEPDGLPFQLPRCSATSSAGMPEGQRVPAAVCGPSRDRLRARYVVVEPVSDPVLDGPAGAPASVPPRSCVSFRIS